MTQHEAFGLVRNSFKSDRLAHAYILAGEPRGNGLALAEDICRLLLCRDPAGAPPCMACDDCETASRHIHADTLWLEPEKKSRAIGVDAIRGTLLPWAATGSYSGGWKICVILFADRLNESAANAFLKTLEEPAERVLFLLVTAAPENLLPTIISRCQRINLSQGRRVPAEPWRGKTQEILAAHSNATALRIFATAGSLVSLFEEIKDEAEKIEAAERKNSELDEDPETTLARVSARSKEMRAAVFATIKEWYRDILVLSLKTGGETLFNAECREELARKASGCAPKLALQYGRMVDEMMTQIEVRNIRDTLAFPYWFTWLK
jgi:DNA polymerase III, gamma/tau subunits